MEFKINTEFAKKFNERKQREELQKLKSKYEDEDDDESTSESEDEEAKALTQQLDKKWFLTLAAIKSKNPKIYDPKVNFFDKVEDGTNSSSSSSSSSSPKPTKKKNTKSCLLNDYQNKFLIEKGGIESNSEEEEDDDEKVDENIDGGGGGGGGGDGLTRGWIQNDDSDLKESIKMLSKDDDDDEDGEELFRMTSGKQGTRSKGVDGDVSHVSWLKGQQDDLDDMEAVEVLKPLKQKWTSANLDEDEKFLRDYILEQKYLDHDDDDHDGDHDDGDDDEDDEDDDSCDDDKEDGDKKGKDDDDEGGILKKKTTTMKNDDDDDDDEEEEEEEERREAEFEHKYNYRFEEPDALFIKSYPRTIADTVRRQEKKRRMEKRREVEDKKNQEKLKKKAEMERYAKLKKKEEDKKLKKLEKVRGGSINTSLVNLDGDFDAEEHDRFMKKNFGKKFYEEMDYGEDDDDKPDFKNLDSDNEYYDWDEWDGATHNDDNEDEDDEDEDENTKNNYNGTGKEKVKKKKKSKKKKSKDPPPVKCQSRFAVALERNRGKPVFDPSKKSFETYVSTYYKLECEDEIDGAPCRFKYKNVFPADYGLSTDEVLEAPDQELNAWVPIKRINACKTDEEEILLDRVIRKKKRKNKVLKSLYAEPIVEKAKDENVQENIERIFKTDSKIIKNKPPNSVMCPEPKGKKIKLSNNEKEGNNLATEKAEIKTGKKKLADRKKKLQTEMVEETNEPMKGKDSKCKRKEKPKLTLSAARLAAYNIDPKKFKYYYLPKMQQVK